LPLVGLDDDGEPGRLQAKLRDDLPHLPLAIGQFSQKLIGSRQHVDLLTVPLSTASLSRAVIGAFYLNGMAQRLLGGARCTAAVGLGRCADSAMPVVLGSGSTSNGVGGGAVHRKPTQSQQLSFRQALSSASSPAARSMRLGIVPVNRRSPEKLIAGVGNGQRRRSLMAPHVPQILYSADTISRLSHAPCIQSQATCVRRTLQPL
jgi:hypothetical protein